MQERLYDVIASVNKEGFLVKTHYNSFYRPLIDLKELFGKDVRIEDQVVENIIKTLTALMLKKTEDDKDHILELISVETQGVINVYVDGVFCAVVSISDDAH